MNSLIIVADAARARLFRTARTNDPRVPVELVEVGAVDCQARAQDETLPRFAGRVAAGTAAFARFHFCNPLIVVGDRAVSAAIFAELEKELPNAHVRRVMQDMAERTPVELMQQLQKLDAFTPLSARTPGTIPL